MGILKNDVASGKAGRQEEILVALVKIAIQTSDVIAVFYPGSTRIMLKYIVNFHAAWTKTNTTDDVQVNLIKGK